MATGSSFDVISLMRSVLPEYVVNCLLASGYDVADVISTMDISDNPGNSIETIEKFIKSHYPNQKEYHTPILPG